MNSDRQQCPVGCNEPMAAGGYDWFQWTTEGLLMALVGAVGLVGNLTSVIIYGRQRVQRTFHRLLLTLAAFDTVRHLSFAFLRTVKIMIFFAGNCNKGH